MRWRPRASQFACSPSSFSRPGDGGTRLQIPGKVPPPGLRVKRFFAQAVYRPDAEGRLRPRTPARCPFAQGRQACSLRVNHYRARKTGPRYPVAVVGCRIHGGGCFTLYPPGHIPYGRKPLAPTSTSGVLYVDVGTGHPFWGATLFSAPVDASKGVRWHEESLSGDARRRRTQGRRQAWAGLVLGVDPSLEEPVRERIAERLGVPLLRLREACTLWQTPWPSRGRAVTAVLDALPATGALPDRILAAGAAAGLWGEPMRWRGRRRLHCCSDVPEQVAMADTGARGPPPTTSPVPPQGEGR